MSTATTNTSSVTHRQRPPAYAAIPESGKRKGACLEAHTITYAQSLFFLSRRYSAAINGIRELRSTA